MRDRDVIAASLEHQFHSFAGVDVIVDQQQMAAFRADGFLPVQIVAISAIPGFGRRFNRL